jgi:hypothetical protein
VGQEETSRSGGFGGRIACPAWCKRWGKSGGNRNKGPAYANFEIPDSDFRIYALHFDKQNQAK